MGANDAVRTSAPGPSGAPARERAPRALRLSRAALSRSFPETRLVPMRKPSNGCSDSLRLGEAGDAWLCSTGYTRGCGAPGCDFGGRGEGSAHKTHAAGCPRRLPQPLLRDSPDMGKGVRARAAVGMGEQGTGARRPRVHRSLGLLAGTHELSQARQILFVGGG